MAPVNPDKKNNVLNIWGNEKTMNLNNMILTNILSSHYFKVNLYQLKTYHEVIDEIYYHVNHLEPWEKGSRKTSGQTGMCGGVRGVGAGGIVSTAFCILYKLFTLKLTRKQVVGLLTHCDSAYIRALGFMYIRYTQHPGDLWEWYEAYLDDEEEVDVKAGGGQMMTIGEMLRHFLSKLEWFSTLFPRIPVPIQKDIEKKLSTCKPPPKAVGVAAAAVAAEVAEGDPNATAEAIAAGLLGAEETGEETNKTCRSSVSKEKAMKDADVAEEIARERDRQRREKTPVRLHHRHRSRAADYKDRNKNSSHVRSRSQSRSRGGEHGRHHRTDKYERHPSEKNKSSSHHRSRSRSSERRRNRKHKSSHH